MITLGIETSCDETAAAVVSGASKIISSIISSSLSLHKRYGGVIPEIASRAHLESISFVVERALKRAKKTKEQIDLIAVTRSPGLPGSLLVGTSFAQALSFALAKPLIEVDHVQAHLYAAFLQKKKPRFPFVGFVISGGHTELFYVKDFLCSTLLGTTLDDAAGEAFDKVAKILRLGYPGGPAIDKISQQAKNKSVSFGCARMKDSFDFSFSGVKTSVLYFTQDARKMKSLTNKDIAYGFQNTVVDVLVEKALAACKHKKTRTLVIGGGVTANLLLRKKLAEEAHQNGIDVFFPEKSLCVDNAAMVAGLGSWLYQHKKGGK
ncbi:tRNA (adenosine(37)-N6)-threonylcarbamoyltransferase complex transferase subunit TsaD [Candidatus Omnitrophota bacterium]